MKEHKRRFQSIQHPIVANVLLLGFLSLLMLGQSGCPAVDQVLRVLRTSDLAGKNLEILVLPPIKTNSKKYASTSYSKALHEFIMEGMSRINKHHNYYIRSYFYDDEELTQLLYQTLMEGTGEERKKFLKSFCKIAKTNQVIFGRYKYNPSSNKMGLVLYLYDADENIIGKEPASGFRWVYWRSKESISEHISRMTRDLISKNF